MKRELYQVFYQQCGGDSDVITRHAMLDPQEAHQIEERLEEMEAADLIQYASIMAVADIDKVFYSELCDILNAERGEGSPSPAA